MGPIFAESELFDRLFNYGVPTVALAVFCFAGYKVGLWLRAKVIEPLMAAHLGLVSSIKETQGKLGDAVSGLRQAADQQTVELKKQTNLLIDTKEAAQTTSKTLVGMCGYDRAKEKDTYEVRGPTPRPDGH